MTRVVDVAALSLRLDALENEVRELRLLVTPVDHGSLPRDVPALAGGLSHLSPADRESVRRLNEALGE